MVCIYLMQAIASVKYTVSYCQIPTNWANWQSGSDNRKRSRRDNVWHEERSRFRRTHCRCHPCRRRAV